MLRAAALVLFVSVAAAELPLSPGHERETFRLAPGYRIDLLAAEPQIESPVAAAFDEKARLWVVEMRDYPNGPVKGGEPQGRIKILEDRDGDGRYETATVFADKLLFANGVLPWGDGAIVTAAPEILFLHDTDGDGRCDRREVLYEGFSAGNPQLRVSHPVLGPDGWIYVVNGLRGGEIRRGGLSINISGKDFRFDLLNDRAEAIPGLGQFGNCYDRWGNRFVCDNRNHLRHVVFHSDPAARNKYLPARPLIEDVGGAADGPLSSGTKVFPISRNWTTSNLHAGRFTAACGVFIDRGGLLPENMAFTCEPTGNLLHAEMLTPQGASFRSKPWKAGVEFLASTDEWFRPVSLAQAPDGSMILIDMYRAVIEHPEFMPPELKQRPDLTLGRERGRIWRIAPETCKPARMEPKLDSPVAALGDANGWRRTTAQRLLLADPKSTSLIQQHLGALAVSADGLILAAWLLEAKGALTGRELRLLKDGPAPVREHAVRLMELRKPTGQDLRVFADDDVPRVRFQTAFALAACMDETALQLLAKIAERDSGDPWMRLAVSSAAGERAGSLIAQVSVSEPNDPRLAMVRELAEIVGSRRDALEVAALIDTLSNRNAPWQRAGITGLADGVARRGTTFPAYLATLTDAKPVLALLSTAAQPADDATAAESERTAAIRLLAHTPWDAASPVLSRLLEAESPAIRSAAIRATAAHNDKTIPALLLKGWKCFTPSLRSEVLEVLTARPERIAALLDAVEAGTVRPADIDPLRARRLMASRHGERATKLLKDSLPADRKEVLAKYRDALTLTGDAVKGREVFKANCANCHAVAGIGTGVGPDISDTRTKTAEMLLADILTPNAAIDGKFIAYTLTTKDGRTLSGVIAAESAAAVTLKRDGSQTDTVLRADIDELKSSGLSLMPDGLEKTVTPQQMADLIRFLKDWRYQK